MTEYSYIKDPEAIYAESFKRVRAALQISPKMSSQMPQEIIVRLIHACGMPDIIDDLAFSDGVISAGPSALQAGKPIFCDCEMVASGITRRFLPADNPVIVTLNDPKTPVLAGELSTTRSAAAVDLWDNRLDGAIVAIGNAPTALFRLLENMASGGPVPAVIFGFPVGFVGALESKAALALDSYGADYLTLHGTRGGSALAAAAVNALCLSACKDTSIATGAV